MQFSILASSGNAAAIAGENPSSGDVTLNLVYKKSAGLALEFLT